MTIKMIKAEVTKEMIEAAKRIKIPMSVCADTDHYWDVFLTEVLESATTVEPAHGHYYNADDIDRLVRELDVLINGEEGAAPQAKLCDIVAQMRKAQPAPVEGEPVAHNYLLNGTRFKISVINRVCGIYGLPAALNGQWVALVDATDNKHMQSTAIDAETRALALSLCNNVISYEFAGSLDDDAKKLKKLLGAG